MNKIIETINKLKAKAEGTTNEAEAEIFANKVHELLMKHNLSQMDLDIPVEDDIVQHEYDAMYSDPWRTLIVANVAKLFLCEAITRRKRYGDKVRRIYVLIGKKTNCEVAQDLCEYLIATTVMLGREYSPIRRERLGFERGCGTRLAQRVNHKYHESKKYDPRNPDNLPALYQSEEERVESWIGEHMPNLRAAKPTQQEFNEHSVRGKYAADYVPIKDKEELR